jgi:hypothetical protein
MREEGVTCDRNDMPRVIIVWARHQGSSDSRDTSSWHSQKSKRLVRILWATETLVDQHLQVPLSSATLHCVMHAPREESPTHNSWGSSFLLSSFALKSPFISAILDNIVISMYCFYSFTWRYHMAKKQQRDWTGMLAEKDARRRIEEERPEAVLILDYFQSKVKPFEETGWTAFNDWLDQCYRKRLIEKRPTDIPYITLDRLRCVVFPSAK